MALTRITKGVIKPNENYDTHNINSTGIVTAIGLDINGNGDISGNLSVGGVLTYEDVTSIDSVGIITAQSDIHVGAGVSVVGIVTAATGDFFDLDVDGHTNLDNVSVAGVTTFANKVTAAAGANKGIQIGSNLKLTDQANVFIQNTANSSMYLVSKGTQIRDRSNNNIASFSESAGSSLFHHSGSTKKLGTSATGINILEDLDVDGHTNLDNVSISGVTTITNSGGLADFKAIELEKSGTSGASRINFLENGTIRGGLTYSHDNNRIELISENGESIRFQDKANNQFGLINSSGLTLNGDLDVDGHTNLDNVSIAGVTTGTTINATTFVGNLTGNVTGNADTATTATTTERVTLTNQGGDTTCNVLFAQSATGNQLPHTNANLTFNATNGRLTATSFAGDGSNLTGITQTTINSNTNNYLITGTGTANTLQGESSFRYDGNGGLDMEGTGSAFFQIKTPDSTDGGIYFRTGTTNYGAISYLHNSTPSSGRMNFRSGGTTKMDLVGAGHLGVGANNLTKTWSLGKAIHIGNSENAIWGEADYAVHLMQNAYYNGGYKYTHSDEATLYSQEDGRHNFKVTASGSADSAITWTEALRIEQGGIIETGTAIGASGADGNQRLRVGRTGDCNIAVRATGSTTAFTGLDFGDQDDDRAGRIQYAHDGNYMSFHTNGGGSGSANERLRITSGGSVNVGGDYTQTTYKMKVTGSFAATTKSFVIDHPTKENHQLRYACLEGPENSVYVRGKTSDSVIELPDYWKGLVHEDSITVNVTPIGNHKVWVETINNNSVTIGSDGTEYFYTVFAERKDVDKLEVEVAK